MQFRIYDETGGFVAVVNATSEAEALSTYPEDYQAGDIQLEAARLARRAEIDAAKAAFAAQNGLTGASNSAITKAWKRAGKPL